MRLGVRIVTGSRTTSLVAGPAADADLVVGADGIRSTTRRLLDPAAPEPVYAGLYSVSGTARGLDPGAGAGAFNMTFCRAGAFLHVPAPDGTIWWSAQVAARTAPDPATVTPEGVAALFRPEARTKS